MENLKILIKWIGFYLYISFSYLFSLYSWFSFGFLVKNFWKISWKRGTAHSWFFNFFTFFYNFFNINFFSIYRLCSRTFSYFFTPSCIQLN